MLIHGRYRQQGRDGRLAVRQRACGAEDLRSYLKIVGRDPVERERLVKALTIHVSQFFRNPATFEAIRGVVLPAILATMAPSLPPGLEVRVEDRGAPDVMGSPLQIDRVLASPDHDVPILLYTEGNVGRNAAKLGRHSILMHGTTTVREGRWLRRMVASCLG